MPFVITRGALQSVSQPPAPMPPTTMTLSADGFTQDYAAMWRSQPQIRTVVGFLARNVAQLGLHVYRRVSDVDRQRVRDHPLAQLIAKPNPWTTTFRWIEGLVGDLAVYDNAVLAKVRDAAQPRAVVRLDPRGVQPMGDSPYTPEVYRVRGARGHRDLPADQVIHLRGFNPENPRWGASPIETLRRVLAEEYEAGRFREQMWRNGARTSGYLERPLEAPEWSRAAKRRFRAQWQAQYTGAGPDAGGTPILEDGMKFTPASVSPESAQYIEARKLSREEVAAAYFIPPPMVGILDNATYSNIQEQHKHLYQDTLGPWLAMISQELELQLLSDFADSDGLYCEFNLSEKLRGSFEEQAQQLSTSVGAPWMSRNEARARMNLPQVEGGDSLVVPLNVLLSGQTSEQSGAVGGAASPGEAAGTAAIKARLAVSKTRPAGRQDALEATLARHFQRQSAVVRSALGAKQARLRKAAADDVFDQLRWRDELAADLYRHDLAIATGAGRAALGSLGLNPDDYNEDRTQGWHDVAARHIAESITVVTGMRLDEALRTDDPDTAVGRLFETYVSARAAQIAVSQVTAMAGFGTTEALRQTGATGATKTWRVTSTNPRSSHARINGETVPMDERFSNGAQWPGDGVLDEDERAGCRCDVEINLR
ncbi:MAG: phage portal protein [Pseudonocardiaceae bacterium]|nr:phage portal protein [Pseudonocardiaceae bacterium]